MALAGIELRFIVDHISGIIDGYYVNNIYGVTRDSLLFKLRHTSKDDLFLMVSTFGIWLTSTKLGQIEENRMQRRLRSTLLRMRFRQIRQIGAERIAYLEFEGFDSEFVLVAELFGDGNVILCDADMKILALMHSVDVRHRTLKGRGQVRPAARAVRQRGGRTEHGQAGLCIPARGRYGRGQVAWAHAGTSKKVRRGDNTDGRRAVRYRGHAAGPGAGRRDM